MIVKTRGYSGGAKGALNLASYIERGTSSNKEYRTLYYGSREIRNEDRKEIENLASRRNGNSFRHIIIAPENRYEEKVFYYKILQLMDTWIRKTRRYGIRYYWGLHYNTQHPHAHIGLVSPFRWEIVMNSQEIREFIKLVEKTFEEKYSVEKNLQKEIEKELAEAEVEL